MTDTMDDEAMRGDCFHCGAPCTEDSYCFGCESFVCADCSPYYDGPGGDHEPEEHMLHLEMMNEDQEHLCRRIVGHHGGRPKFCGLPAVMSAYCVGHLQQVIAERAAAGKPS